MLEEEEHMVREEREEDDVCSQSISPFFITITLFFGQLKALCPIIQAFVAFHTTCFLFKLGFRRRRRDMIIFRRIMLIIRRERVFTIFKRRR